MAHATVHMYMHFSIKTQEHQHTNLLRQGRYPVYPRLLGQYRTEQLRYNVDLCQGHCQ